MKIFITLLFLITFAGCGSDTTDPDGNNDDNSGASKGWTFDYTGDMTGTIDGDILARVYVFGVSVAGGSIGSLEGDRFNASGTNGEFPKGEIGETENTLFSLLFEDGPECKPVVGETNVMMTVTENTEDTFMATFAGEVECEGTMDRLVLTGSAWEN